MLKPILLVEDDPVDIDLSIMALETCKLSNEIVVARDGEEALRFLTENAERQEDEIGNPAVIFLDYRIPKLCGMDVLKAIRADKRLATIPVVLLTSSHEDIGIEEAYELGANAYVVKPVSPALYIEAISRLGVFWAIINEPPAGTLRSSLRESQVSH